MDMEQIVYRYLWQALFISVIWCKFQKKNSFNFDLICIIYVILQIKIDPGTGQTKP